MAKRQDSISGGSGSKTGRPITIDYRELLAGAKKKQEEELKDYASAEEISELTQFSGSYVRQRVQKARTAGRIKALKRTVGGNVTWFYLLKDVCKEFGVTDA